VLYSSCMSTASHPVFTGEAEVLLRELREDSIRLFAIIRGHDRPVYRWGRRNSPSAHVHTMNINRALAFSSLAVLASSLPAAEPGDENSACSSSWISYDSAWTAWYDEDHPTTTVLTTEVGYPEFDYSVPYTTLCDGYRRAVTSRATVPTTTYDPPKTSSFQESYPEPEPTCTIAETACTAIISSYSSASTAWANDEASTSPGQPHCTTYRPCDSPEYPGEDYCFLEGNVKTVYYWPVTTQSGDFCTSSGLTVVPKPTSPPNPNTAVIDGRTFVSPTNYVSLGPMEAVLHIRRYRDVPNCGGTSYSGVVVPVTGAMTTKGLDGSRSSLNFEDLNTMKFEDFKAQRRCKNNPCAVIEGFYTPELALPTEVLDLQPQEWKAAGCRGTDVGYVFLDEEFLETTWWASLTDFAERRTIIHRWCLLSRPPRLRRESGFERIGRLVRVADGCELVE